jgi:hypothetical protein
MVVLVHTRVLSIGCTITHDDGRIIAAKVTSLSMRGAQREMTTRLRRGGYTPVGRWFTTGRESTRTFREATSHV